jgi:hypothetical protein
LFNRFSLKLTIFELRHTLLLPKELISVLAMYIGMLKMSMKVSRIANFLNMWIGCVREFTKLSRPRGLDVK